MGCVAGIAEAEGAGMKWDQLKALAEEHREKVNDQISWADNVIRLVLRNDKLQESIELEHPAVYWRWRLMAATAGLDAFRESGSNGDAAVAGKLAVEGARDELLESLEKARGGEG